MKKLFLLIILFGLFAIGGQVFAQGETCNPPAGCNNPSDYCACNRDEFTEEECVKLSCSACGEPAGCSDVSGYCGCTSGGTGPEVCGVIWCEESAPSGESCFDNPPAECQDDTEKFQYCDCLTKGGSSINCLSLTCTGAEKICFENAPAECQDDTEKKVDYCTCLENYAPEICAESACPETSTLTPSSTTSKPAIASPIKKLTNPLRGSKADPTGLRLDILAGTIIKSLMGMLGMLAFVVFVFGGFMWLTAAGSAERVKKGTDAMTAAVIGIFIIFSSYAILNLVFDTLKGASSTQVEGSPLTQSCVCKSIDPAPDKITSEDGLNQAQCEAKSNPTQKCEYVAIKDQ